MRAGRITVPLVAGCAVALLVAGCSSSGSEPANQPSPTRTAAASEAGKTGPQVFADAKSALRSTKYVRVAGPIAGKGAAATVLDMRYVNGVGAVGTLTDHGQTIHLIRIGDALYLKGPASLYGNPALAARIGDRYLKVPVTSAGMKDFALVTDLRQLADNLSSTGAIAPRVAAGSAQGQKVLILTDTGDHSTIDVRATGRPVPVQSTTNTRTDKGTVTFTDYDRPVTLTPPAGALVSTGGATPA